MANEKVLPGLPVDPKTRWDARYIDRQDVMPCPFCGEPPVQVVWVHPEWVPQYQIVCGNKTCKCIAATARQKSSEEAVRIWQHRPIITEVVITDETTH